MIINNDCLIALKELPENSIDAIVTDPPYGLSFMGKKWDYDVPSVEIWAECLRVLKPGGYLLSFGGTRTYHRMAVAIEDAGFEIRDQIQWIYGSGFPKSLNIGKAIDGLRGNEREAVWNDRYKDGKTRKTGDSSNWELTSHAGSGGNGNITTKGTSEWEGWGTALKPAHEPICMARKPLAEKTVAENVLKWGTGGINIDGSRVGTEEITTNGKGNQDGNTPIVPQSLDFVGETHTGRFPANLIHDNSEEVRECFPESNGGGKRNIPAYIENGGTGSSYIMKGQKNSPQDYPDSGNASRFFKSIIYQAKASKSERNRGCEGLEVSQKFTAGNYSQSPTCKTCDLTLNGTNDHSECSGEVYYKEMESKNTKNNHPTVKPIALMEYLVKLVSKEGHTVLDPFLGSGTTGIACKNLNRNCIGIERDSEYVKIAEARINAV